MTLFVLLAIFQTILIIPVVFIAVMYWHTGPLPQSMDERRKVLTNFLVAMTVIEAFIWMVSEVLFVAVSASLQDGLTCTTTTLIINFLFVVVMLLAMFAEIRLRDRINWRNFR